MDGTMQEADKGPEGEGVVSVGEAEGVG